MNGYGPVRLSPPPRVGLPNRKIANSARRVDDAGGRRLTAWIVRSIILATTAFAILDLSLLVSSIHH